jgi:hypothetical protein
MSLEEKLDRMFANLDDADVIVTALWIHLGVRSRG